MAGSGKERPWPGFANGGERPFPGAIPGFNEDRWGRHEPHDRAWNAFAASKGRFICTLPRGQGLMLKA